MTKKYPSNTSVCDTDEQWAGMNILRDAFLRSAEGWSHARHVNGPKGPNADIQQVYGEDIPVSWTLETPKTYRRQFFSQEAAQEGAELVQCFLEANGIDVVNKHLDYYTMNGEKPWEDRDQVVVGTNGTSDPIATQGSTIFMLPHMRRPLWNLVRFNDERYEF
ncbi:MAG: hypothetical protein ACLFR0_06035 [Alphaproteobacteria bacterium]